MNYILGINGAYHEPAACLLNGGRIVAAVEEERFNRCKHGKATRFSSLLPWASISHCLASARIRLSDVAHIGYSLVPEERLKNAFCNDKTNEGDWGTLAGEQRFVDMLTALPGQVRDLGFDGQFHWLGHHQCHAASTYYVSPFTEAAVLTIDGIGEFATTGLFHGEGSRLVPVGSVDYPASLGFLWEKLSKFLGFTAYDSYKVMGLAAYGNRSFFREELKRLCSITEEGLFATDSSILRFRVEDYEPLELLFHCKRRLPGDPLQACHADIAAALQDSTEDVFLCLGRRLHALTSCTDLCMAGGVALNCVANHRLLVDGPFQRLFVQPAAHDAGTALGAALLLWHRHLDRPRLECGEQVYLGPTFTEEHILGALRRYGCPFSRPDNLERTAAEHLAKGEIVGYFQGAAEWGPRALGNRSLLADPRNPDIRDVINRRVKHREVFRPFAPSVLAEYAEQWFELPKGALASDYMLITCKARQDKRDRIPAVIHVDGTSRVHTVHCTRNPRFHALISEFRQCTGVPMLLNTSFNDDEPIVCVPEDAIHTFKKTAIDCLAIGQYFVCRE